MEQAAEVREGVLTLELQAHSGQEARGDVVSPMLPVVVQREDSRLELQVELAPQAELELHVDRVAVAEVLEQEPQRAATAATAGSPEEVAVAVEEQALVSEVPVEQEQLDAAP